MSLARPWFRFVFGCGTLKIWVGEDGVHWGRPFDPLVNQQFPYTHLGLYCLQGPNRKAIKLRHVQLRAVAALNDLRQGACARHWPCPRPATRPNGSRPCWRRSRRMPTRPPGAGLRHPDPGGRHDRALGHRPARSSRR